MNLLLVDDEVYVVRTLQKKINWEELGINRVFTAFNVERAKEIFSQEEIDVLVTDIEMPRESGLSLIQWIKEQERECQIICLTCHAEFQYAQEALHYGVMEYVVKPIDFLQLSRIIRRAALQQEEEKKKKRQESWGTLWESNKQQIEAAFWKDVLTGNAGENLDTIRRQAERAQAEFDESEQYLLVLLAVRKISDREKDWQEAGELMKFVLYNIFRETFWQETDKVKAGWSDLIMWVILPAEETEGLRENLENFIHIARKLAGTGVTAYVGTPCFVEELHGIYKELLKRDKDNVSVLQGIVENRQELLEEEEQKKIFRELMNTFHKENWEQMEILSGKVWPDGSTIRKKDFFLELEELHYELYRLLKEKNTAPEVFWTEELAESSRKAYQSVEQCRKWILAVSNRMKELGRNQGEENDTVVWIKKFVEQNLENRISREMIAEQLYFSTDYISRIFKKETGKALSEYIMLQKIERARVLLEEGKDNIGDIAIKLGYNNFSYFSEIFRRITGYLPSDYRRKAFQNRIPAKERNTDEKKK